VSERVVQFGDHRSLVGILSEPEAAVQPAGVVFLNAGVNHRVGPNRLYVRIARRLAAGGTVALRFDLPGLGDSRVPPSSAGFTDAVIHSARAAMEVVSAASGVQQFIFIGLCSGADGALRVAVADERVRGAALIDPYAHASTGYYFYRYRRRLLTPRSWAQLLTGRSELWATVGRLVRTRKPRPAAAAPCETGPHAPPPAQVIASVETLVGRGVSIACVYSGGSPAYYNYVSSFKRGLDRLGTSGHLEVRHFRGADHTFSLLAHQAQLMDWLVDWVARNQCRHSMAVPASDEHAAATAGVRPAKLDLRLFGGEMS